MISIKQSRTITDYRPVLEGLVADFGYIYWAAILEWCGIISVLDEKWKFSEGLFWQVWLVVDGGNTIGICGLYSLDKKTDELWLGWFGIIPSRRNSGIGSNVLNILETMAKNKGCKILRTYVDEAGKPIPFYERNGFRRVSTVVEFCERTGCGVEQFEGLHDHIMEKRLT